MLHRAEPGHHRSVVNWTRFSPEPQVAPRGVRRRSRRLNVTERSPRPDERAARRPIEPRLEGETASFSKRGRQVVSQRRRAHHRWETEEDRLSRRNCQSMRTPAGPHEADSRQRGALGQRRAPSRFFRCNECLKSPPFHSPWGVPRRQYPSTHRLDRRSLVPLRNPRQRWIPPRHPSRGFRHSSASTVGRRMKRNDRTATPPNRTCTSVKAAASTTMPRGRSGQLLLKSVRQTPDRTRPPPASTGDASPRPGGRTTLSRAAGTSSLSTGTSGRRRPERYPCGRTAAVKEFFTPRCSPRAHRPLHGGIEGRSLNRRRGKTVPRLVVRRCTSNQVVATPRATVASAVERRVGAAEQRRWYRERYTPRVTTRNLQFRLPAGPGASAGPGCRPSNQSKEIWTRCSPPRRSEPGGSGSRRGGGRQSTGVRGASAKKQPATVRAAPRSERPGECAVVRTPCRAVRPGRVEVGPAWRVAEVENFGGPQNRAVRTVVRRRPQ